MNDEGLLTYFKQLYDARHAPSTKSSYKTGQKYVLKFLSDNQIHLKNPRFWDDSACALFVAWVLKNRKVKAVSARGYLFGAKAFLRSAGIRVVKETPLTNDILKGHKRLFPAPKRVRKPITFPMLEQMMSKLTILNDHDTLLFAVFLSFAFFGLMRLGELLKAHNVNTTDIEFYPNLETPQMVKIFVHSTKTSPFEGRTLFLGATGKLSCPVFLARLFFITYQPSRKSHFFTLRNKKRLSYVNVISTLRALLEQIGVDSSLYAGHSIKRGGAQSAADADFTLCDIKELGDWKSDSYRLYFQNAKQKSNFTKRISKNCGSMFQPNFTHNRRKPKKSLPPLAFY